MDILRMLDQLQELAVNQPRHVGPIFWKVDIDEISVQITKIRASLPQEVKQAANLTRESSRVIESAKDEASKTIESSRIEANGIVEHARKEAEAILEQARLEQTRMISDNEVLRLAKSQSDEIRLAANEDAADSRRQADQYAHTVLGHIETVLERALGQVGTGRADLEMNLHNNTEVAPNHALIEQPVERVRV